MSWIGKILGVQETQPWEGKTPSEKLHGYIVPEITRKGEFYTCGMERSDTVHVMRDGSVVGVLRATSNPGIRYRGRNSRPPEDVGKILKKYGVEIVGESNQKRTELEKELPLTPGRYPDL